MFEVATRWAPRAPPFQNCLSLQLFPKEQKAIKAHDLRLAFPRLSCIRFVLSEVEICGFIRFLLFQISVGIHSVQRTAGHGLRLVATEATWIGLAPRTAMVKAAAGLQQKRSSKQAIARAAKDHALMLQKKQAAAKSGLTLEAARQRNIEKAAAAAERKAIKKEKRERRKDAKAQVKETVSAKAAADEHARASMLISKEREERRAAAAAAAAARAEEEANAARKLAKAK